MKLWLTVILCGIAAAQDTTHQHARPASIPLQPLAQQVRQLEEAMNYLGQPFAAADLRRIHEAIANPDEAAAVRALESILDAHVLLNVDINPESRVKVEQGAAKPELVEAGTRLFLVKVINNGQRARAARRAESEQRRRVRPVQRESRAAHPALPAGIQGALGQHLALPAPADAAAAFRPGAGVRHPRSLQPRRGTALRQDQLQRRARASQDIGFRNDVTVLFTALPARRITLRVKDEKGRPDHGVLHHQGPPRPHLPAALQAPRARLFLPAADLSRRRRDPCSFRNGYYTVEYTGGPEYLTRTREFAADSNELSFQLERWIDPAKFGWFSGDHHVHAAGCSHYMNPTEGVQPEDMMRQILGEHLNIGSVLTWGPDYYYQKQFFSAKDHPLSKPDRLMHYDLEVSGFPSSHAGHIVLLDLKQQDYPGTKKHRGLAHLGPADFPLGEVAGRRSSGLRTRAGDCRSPARNCRHYQMPGFDGIGANEYIVDVTHPDTVDFISAVDTPYVWELNIWYHTLNVGFRTRISGETDFPCIYDGRVGLGRTYAKVDGALTYEGWLRGLQAGRSYVSDGKTHLMDFRVNGTGAGRAPAAAKSGSTPPAT